MSSDVGSFGLKLDTFKYFLLFFVILVVVVVERFVARVLQGGKVTIPKRLRELLNVEEGDYVRLDLVEVIEVKQKRGG
jgi:AbrB family looped-hinge helix DNA binding protein